MAGRIMLPLFQIPIGASQVMFDPWFLMSFFSLMKLICQIPHSSFRYLWSLVDEPQNLGDFVT
jgi:hypothetical protein